MVTYKPTPHGWGRVNPKYGNSISLLRGALRHTICEGVYFDSDMVNAFPTILLNICEYHNMECKWLKKYIDNREPWLRRLVHNHECTTDEAKKLIIALMNGKKYTTTLIATTSSNDAPIG